MTESKRRWSIDPLVLIFSMIVVAQLLTYFVPRGQFEREPSKHNPNHEQVVPGTFAPLTEEQRESVSVDLGQFLLAIPKGLAEAQEIIFLVFLVGGVIALLRRTGAIDAFLMTAVRRLSASPWILIAGCLLIFATGSFTIGMGEEYVPLIPILVTMCLSMKMDSIVAMGMVWVPYGIGWACAGTNPFGVVIAQNIAGLPIQSGWELRLCMMLVFLLVGFQHLYSYARRIQRDPSKSYVGHVDYSSGFEQPEDTTLTGPRISILVLFVAGLGVFVWGAAARGWYIAELCAIFMAIGLIAAAIAKFSPNVTSRTFIEGASEMTSAALLIGFAKSIEVVLKEGKVIDTIIHGIASLLEGASAEVSAVGMLAVQTICNCFIPSGSGQAYVTMPIMSPIATLTDVPQQTAVLAYQFGDGFTNMLVPTSALVMGTLALGRIPYGAWFRFCAPLLLKLFAVAIAMLILTIHLESGFGFHPQ